MSLRFSIIENKGSLVLNDKVQMSSSSLKVKPLLYTCTYPTCERSFSSTRGVKLHMLSHTLHEPYRCLVENCLFYCQSEEDYRAHLGGHLAHLAHPRSKTVEDIAVEALIEMSTTNICPAYENTHKETVVSHFRCRIGKCDRSYTRKANLVRHQKQAHPGCANSFEIIIET